MAIVRRFLSFWLIIVSIASAQDDEWVGRQFLPKITAVAISVDARFDPSKVPMPLLVKEVHGEWLNVGGGLFRKSDVIPLEQADQYYTECLDQNPLSSRAYHCRAQARTFNGMHDQAIKDYTEAIRLNPEKAIYHRNRGSCWHYKKHNLDEALKDYNEAIRLDPLLISAYDGRGALFRERNDFVASLADYDEAIRLDRKNERAFYGRGLTNKTMGKLAAALEDFEATTRLDANTDPNLK